MSDFFSALLRSADARAALPSAAAVDNGQAQHRYTAPRDDEPTVTWGEETVQTEAAGGREPSPDADPTGRGSPLAARAGGPVTAPPNGSHGPAAVDDRPSQDPSPVTAPGATGAPTGAVQIPGADDPRVQAALRWVSAGPSARQVAGEQRAAPARDERHETAAHQGVEVMAASLASAATPARQAEGAPAARAIGLLAAALPVAAPAALAQPESREAARAMASGDSSREGPRAAGTTAPAWSTPADDRFARTRPARRAAEGVEVHIGSIQLRVDAPPAARAVAAPAPPTPATAPARTAPTNTGWSRSRLPRL